MFCVWVDKEYTPHWPFEVLCVPSPEVSLLLKRTVIHLAHT